MARDALGAYALPAGNPVITLTTITSAWANATMADLASEVTNSLDRSGRGSMLAPFKAFAGTSALPGVTWDLEQSSGLWRAGAADFRYTIGGVQVAGVTAAGLQQMDGAGAVFRGGFRDIPQVLQSAAYTLLISDAGKHIYHPSADTTARVWTIPANASVAFPIGTAVTFVNDNAAGPISIGVTSDTMRLAGAGTTGTRTLAANGVCTALKMTATSWIISGTGLT